MHDLDPANLRAFVAVAESGAFTAAAERLHLTQPAVTRRVQALEAQLGQPLFDRLPRRALLTEAGQRLLPRARQALAALEACRQTLEGMGERVEGSLALGTSHHIGLHHLPPVLRRYHRRHPGVRLNLSFLGSEAALAAVARGDLDLALVTLPPEDEGELVLRPLWTDPLELVVARDHPLAALRPFRITALSDHPAVLPEEGTVTRRLATQALEGWGVQLRVALASNHLEILRMLVETGLGWSLLPRTLVHDRLATLPLPHPVSRRLGAAHHPRRQLSRAASAFLDLLPG